MPFDIISSFRYTERIGERAQLLLTIKRLSFRVPFHLTEDYH